MTQPSKSQQTSGDEFDSKEAQEYPALPTSRSPSVVASELSDNTSQSEWMPASDIPNNLYGIGEGRNVDPSSHDDLERELEDMSGIHQGEPHTRVLWMEEHIARLAPHLPAGDVAAISEAVVDRVEPTIYTILVLAARLLFLVWACYLFRLFGLYYHGPYSRNFLG